MRNYIFSIIFIFSIAIANKSFAQNKTITNQDTIQPEYPGGINALRHFISKNIKHPIISQTEGKDSGLVVIRFIVDTLGNITQPKILKTIDRYYATEALRILNLSKKWTPGSLNGKKVNVAYTLPIRFHKNEISLKDAVVIMNGELVPQKDILNYIPSTHISYNFFPQEFTKALLGDKYNFPLITIQNPNFIKKSKVDLENTINNIKNIDTTKFRLLIDYKDAKTNIWLNFLTSDSIKNILIHKAPEKNHYLGVVNLLTDNMNQQFQRNFYKAEADKQTFTNLLAKYRKNEIPLTDKLIYIDNYNFNTKWIMDSLDISIIQHIRIANPQDVLNKFQDSRKNGYIQIYTEDYAVAQETKFRNQLIKILEEYKTLPSVNDNYYIFVNNNRSNLEEVNNIPFDRMRNIHIITKTRAQELFGTKEDKPIIYIHTK